MPLTVDAQNRNNEKDELEEFILASREVVDVLYSDLNNFFESLSDNEKIIFGELVFPRNDKISIRELLIVPVEQVLNKKEQLLLEEVQSTPVHDSHAQSSAIVVILKATP